MSNLFIIGNGFDLAHGFATHYSDFKTWIENQLPAPNPLDAIPLGFFVSRVNKYEDYINGLQFIKDLFDSNKTLDDKWNSFENSLSGLPIYDKCQSLIDFTLEPNEAFENPARYDDVCLNVANLIQENIANIPKYFHDWIDSVDISKPKCKLAISDSFSCDSLYINFNYTETLEDTYGVSKSQICHIHGNRTVWSDDLIVGHSDFYHFSEQEFECPSVKPILDEAISRLKKNTDSIILSNIDFLCKIDKSITDIYAYGFSFGQQDIPYIRYICMQTSSNVTWHLSDYDDEPTREKITALLRNLGCKGKVLTFESGPKS